MLNTCGKSVNSLWVSAGTSCGTLPTSYQPIVTNAQTMCAEAQVLPIVVPFLHPGISTLFSAILPLFEQKFYPFSTGPIISITNFKKEGEY